ncbi:MAG: hypothetical protein Q9185_005611 [Variospora sp. 1 TL-2023]
MKPLAQITNTTYALMLLLILTLSPTAHASPFKNATPITSFNLYRGARSPPGLPNPVQVRSPNIPPTLSALNTTHLTILRSYHLRTAPVPNSILKRFFTAAYDIVTLTPEAFGESITFHYGNLRTQIVSKKQLARAVVQQLVQDLGKLVERMPPMFFEAAWETVSGYLVFVMFGIPPEVWWRRNELDVP